MAHKSAGTEYCCSCTSTSKWAVDYLIIVSVGFFVCSISNSNSGHRSGAVTGDFNNYEQHNSAYRIVQYLDRGKF